MSRNIKIGLKVSPEYDLASHAMLVHLEVPFIDQAVRPCDSMACVSWYVQWMSWLYAADRRIIETYRRHTLPIINDDWRLLPVNWHEDFVKKMDFTIDQKREVFTRGHGLESHGHSCRAELDRPAVVLPYYETKSIGEVDLTDATPPSEWVMSDDQRAALSGVFAAMMFRKLGRGDWAFNGNPLQKYADWLPLANEALQNWVESGADMNEYPFLEIVQFCNQDYEDEDDTVAG